MNTPTRTGKILPFVLLLAAGVMVALWLRRGGSVPRKSDAEFQAPKPPSSVVLGSSATSGHLKNPAASGIDLSALLDQALLEQDPQKRSIEFGRLLTQWFEQAPEAALAYVQKMSRGAEYTEGLFIVLSGLGKSDPERAVTLAGEMAGTHEDRMIYRVLFDQIARGDLASALAYLPLAPVGEARENALRTLSAAWSEKDMVGALNWAEALGEAGDRTAALEPALAALAKEDPRRMFDLALKYLSGDALERTVATGLKQLTLTDPSAAGQVISQLPAGPWQTQAAFDVAHALADQQPETAFAWLKTLPPGELQQAVLNKVMDLWSASNPADASQYVAHMAAGADQDAAASRLAQRLANTDRPDAIRWVNGLESESARNAALVSIASGWAQSDPAAATRWAGTLASDNPARAEAMRGALSYWVMTDAVAAANFASSLPAAEQSNAIVNVATEWLKTDAASAQNWLATVNLPAEAKARLLGQ